MTQVQCKQCGAALSVEMSKEFDLVTSLSEQLTK